MKKLLLFLCFQFSISYVCMAQENLVELLSEQQSVLQDSLYNYLENKNFKEAEKIGLESIKLFSSYSEADFEDEYDFEEFQELHSYNYYNMACLYSLQKKKKEAISNLEKAINLGFPNYRLLTSDEDLDYIRNDKNFIRLKDILKEQKDYLHILKKDHAYQTEENLSEDFMYEGTGNWRIRNVREYFNLDSVAGNGDEVSKIINIMAFVHNAIPHDGSHWPNCELDAVDIYNYSKANNNRGVNCRALSIVLNECYLSMGFPSRFITCLPKDKEDYDCHVINSVWSSTLNKWLWMDPSFYAYLSDEDGNLLSIQEVREYLIQDKVVVLNEDANRNNTTPQSKEWYIDEYMAKNLYWFDCPLRSIFNVETNYRNTNEKYISLVPAGYERKNSEGNLIITHDPAFFWKAPSKVED